MYNITSNQWTWLSGNGTIDVFGSFGTKGASSSINYPGGRACPTMALLLNSLYVFGGSGFGQSGYAGKRLNTSYNDLNACTLHFCRIFE
jgi:hypothetical protein